MTTYTTEGLPGHITVWAPHPKLLLNLVPTKECIFPKHIFGEVSVLPAWCTIMKCRHYKEDLGYFFFNAQTRLFDVLTASHCR